MLIRIVKINSKKYCFRSNQSYYILNNLLNFKFREHFHKKDILFKFVQKRTQIESIKWNT